MFVTFLVSFAFCSDGHILTAAEAILCFFSIIMHTHDGVANNDDVRCFGHTFALSRKEGVGWVSAALAFCGAVPYSPLTDNASKT